MMHLFTSITLDLMSLKKKQNTSFMWIKTKTALQCDFLPDAEAKNSYMIERIVYFDRNDIIPWIAKSCKKREPSLQGKTTAQSSNSKTGIISKLFDEV